MERRREERYDLGIDCIVYHKEVEYSAHILNISTHGIALLIENTFDMEESDPIYITFIEPTTMFKTMYKKSVVMLKAKIVRFGSNVVGCSSLGATFDDYITKRSAALFAEDLT